MELRHLRYFVAIAEERSITRAAERLWIAQPGLSTQVRRLEAELGIQLLHRHTRGVELTGAGEVFLERARATLAAAEEARSTGRELEAGLVGSLRVGIATELPTLCSTSSAGTATGTRAPLASDSSSCSRRKAWKIRGRGRSGGGFRRCCLHERITPAPDPDLPASGCDPVPALAASAPHLRAPLS